MRFLLCLFLVDFVVSDGVRNDPECGLRRTYGRDVRDGNFPEYPFIASILEFKPRKLDAEFMCAAALVSKRHLITAAHCFDDRPMNPRYYSVMTESQTTRAGLEFDIERIDKFPLYREGSAYDDIALLTLKHEAHNNTIPVCLPTAGESYDQRLAYVLEYTPIYNGHMKVSMSRQIIAKRSDCEEVYQNTVSSKLLRGVSMEHLCTDKRSRQSHCIAYDGSPVVVNDKNNRLVLAGVATFRENCTSQEFPGFFTKITPYLGWLERMMKP
ncbi:clotting factor B [Galendromus occidentalis]|uniref:Clotting factor B n=1 Tax=Galendromus occidentalis TaxID=34638 RepID=A0AAJ6QT01_9ACAR|nr:clotting factor B [Galendromus occidentalis]